MSADHLVRSEFCADRLHAKPPGERPGSSPQPPEAGARRARLYGVLSAADNWHREAILSPLCEPMFAPCATVGDAVPSLIFVT